MKLPPDLAERLSELRPIHDPPPVSWWPPAPGWWVSALILAVPACFLLWRFFSGRMRRAALAELRSIVGRSDLDDRDYASALSILLKRYAMHCLPGEDVASLTGSAWLEFLDSRLDGDAFQKGPGRVLGGEVYAPGCRVDRRALASLAERWIKKVQCRSGMKGPGLFRRNR